MSKKDFLEEKYCEINKLKSLLQETQSKLNSFLYSMMNWKTKRPGKRTLKSNF